MSTQARLLIVDDEAAQMKALCDTLGIEGYLTAGFTSPTEALAALQAQRFDVMLTDLFMPQTDGIEMLRAAQAIDEDLVAILMTGHGTIDTAVEAMKAGAFDYILKPFKLREVLPVLERALKVRRLRSEKAAAIAELEAFSYSVSHDLRAPLRAITGFTDILLAEHRAGLPEDGQHLLQMVSSSAHRMDQLIMDLLRLSQLNRAPLRHAPVDPGALAREVFEGLSSERAERQVEFQVAELPQIEADESLLRQVFVNLLSNALKFTRNRPIARIEVGGRIEQGTLECFVRDNGAGFDMKYAGKLFGAFQRMHSARDFEGTGVGLSIVKRIAERHGGRVWAEAAVERGASIYFTLPLERQRR